MIAAAPTTLANGVTVMDANFTKRVPLLINYTEVTLEHVQQFAQWYNGDDAQRLDAPFGNYGARKVITLDPNANGNVGLVRRYKLQLRIISKLALLTLRSHITQNSFKSLMAHKAKFAFTSEQTGATVYDGLIVVRMCIAICKPETIVDVRHLEVELDSITLWPTMKNDVRLLTSKMLNLLQEIHAKSGEAAYTDRRFLTNVFRACLTTPTEKFEVFVEGMKQDWIMEKLTDRNEVISSLDKMYKNMLAEGTWKNTNEKDTKVVALTSKLRKTDDKLKSVQKQLEAVQQGQGRRAGKGGQGGDKKTMKERCPQWQVNKKGTYIDHPKTGEKYAWCPHHTSKDGSLNGCYMKHPHDHEEWKKKKDERRSAAREGRREKRKADDSSGPASGDDENKGSKSKMKLALNQRLATALVTQHHLSQNEADDLFNECYKDAEASLN